MTVVLVLDDKPADRELLGAVLEYAGYSVELVGGGKAAIELIREARPDLILTAALAAEMTGYEFVRLLRQDPAFARIPVVFSTIAYDEVEVRRLAEACGVTHVLVKPSDPEEIARLIGSAFGADQNSAPRIPTQAQFDREQLRDVNEKLIQKVRELEVANREQHKLQVSLHEAERGEAESLTLLETLQSTAPVGFGFIDLDLRVARMNETLATMNGVPLDEQIGRKVSEMVPALWSQIGPIYEQVLESGEAIVNVEVEGPSLDPSGGTSFRLVSYYPVRIDGEIIGIGVIVVDITALKRAEDFRAVVMENMVDGLYTVDHEGKLTFMNPAASRMLGWSEDELRGKPIHEAIHFQRPDGRPYPAQECEGCRSAVMEGRTVRNKEDAYTRKNGSIVPVSSSVAPLLTGTNDRGAVVVFRDETHQSEKRVEMQRELDALAWVGRIREALDEDRFVLYSQPIVPLRGGRPADELLLRMLGREGETISPGSFMPVAERFGLTGEIDMWVIREAVRLAADGQRITANLSAESVSELDPLEVIERELQDTGADPADVIFELTETALMANLDAGEAFARGLAELGCGLALDDFGTGFGSFTYLKRMPISFLKIDIEFVRDIVNNPANQHLAKATIGLARDFGYETIAEGVEDAETLALLKEYGVDYAQGYHLGRPAPLVTDTAYRVPISSE